MTQLFTEELAREAVGLVVSAIANAGIVFAKRSDGHLVILDPHVSRDVEPRILYEMSFGNPKRWEHPYDEIARAKARLSFRTGQNTRIVATEEPWLFREGDTKYVGSVVSGPSNLLVVAFSGAEDYVDEMYSHWVAAAIQAVCRRAYHNLPAENNFPWGDLLAG